MASDDVVGPDGAQPERESHDTVVLQKRLEDAVVQLNPHLPSEARADALRKLTQSVFPALLEENREDLQKLLARASGGVIFTSLQKFGEMAEPLTARRNVVVIADEAHRSQYGFRAKGDAKTGEVSYGFAKYMRDALPNASFIGFTGTPIEATDVNTPAVFGNYIDIYDISRAVERRCDRVDLL